MSKVKWWLDNLSLAGKLTAIGIAASASSLAIAAVVLVAYDRSNSKADILGDTTLLADVVATSSTAALTFGDAKDADEALHAVSVNKHIVSAAILLPDGRVLAHYARPGAASPPPLFADAATVRAPWHAFTGNS